MTLPAIARTPELRFAIHTTPAEPQLSPANLLVIGLPKAGKTPFITTWQEAEWDGRKGLLVLQCDRNQQSLQAVPGVQRIEIDTPKMLVQDVLPWLKAGGPDVATIAIDSASFYGSDVEDSIEATDQRKFWGEYKDTISGFFRDFTKLSWVKGNPKPYHVLCSVHLREKSTQVKVGNSWEKRILSYEPAILGSTRDIFQGFFDMVMYVGRTRESQGINKPTLECLWLYPRDPKDTNSLEASLVGLGGSLWGRYAKDLPDRIPGSYSGLREACGVR